MASATRLLWLDVSIGAPRSLATGDTVAAPGDWTFSENVVISGDLTVNGTTTSINTQDVLIADRFTLHNSNYTTDTAQTAGITFNVDPAATSFAITTVSENNLSAAGGVLAGDYGFLVSSSPVGVLDPGDIIVVTGLTVVPGNNGLYEVKGVSTAPNQVAIKTSPDTSVSGIVNTTVSITGTPPGDEADTGTLVQTQITVIRADDTGGTMSIGSGDATPITFQVIEVGTGGSATLQTAYVNGNTITTSAAEGNVTIQGTEDFVVGGSVDVDMNTSGFVSLDAAAASNFTVTGAGIDLSLQSAAGRTVIEGGEAAADAVRIQATNAAGGIDIDSGTAGTLIDSTGAISLDGVGASNFTTDTGNLTLSTTTSGTLALTSAGAWTVDAEDDSTINVAGNLTTLLDETQTADTATAGNAYTVTTGIGSAAGATNVGGIGGNLHLFGGAGGAASASNNDGGAGAEIHLLPGTGGTGATAQAGGTGGELKLDGGTGGAPGTGQGGTGGAVTITGGTGGAGTGTQAGRNGGLTSIDAGAGGADGGAGAGGGGKMEIGRNNAITIDGGSSITEWNLFASALGGFDFSSAAAETQELFSLTTTGTNGDSTEFFVGQSDPSAGAGVAAPVSSIFFRDSGGSGTTGELWLKTGVANTAWEQFQTGADPTSLQTAYDTGNTITTSNAEGGPVAITTTSAESDSGLTVASGGGAAGAQDLVVFTGTALQSGAVLQLNNAGTGEAIEILGITNVSAGSQIDITLGAAAFTGLPRALDIDYSGATSITNAASVAAINLVGKTNAGSGDSFGIVFDSGWDYSFQSDSNAWYLDNRYILFGTDGDGAGTPDFFLGFTAAGKAALNLGDWTGGAAAGVAGNSINVFAQVGGDATGGGVAGSGGDVGIESADGGNAGTAVGETPGVGGDVTIDARNGGQAATAVNLVGATGGDVTITAGRGGAGNGVGTTSGNGGNVVITSGDVGSAVGGTASTTFGTIQLESQGTETHEVVTLVNTTNTVELYTGTSTPNGAVTGSAGSLFLRDTGSSGEVYVNTSTGSGTTWTLLSAAGGTTLQSAYEAGNTINATAAEGNIAFTLTSADFTVDGANDILFGNTTRVSNFSVLGTASSVITLDGAASSTINIGTNTGASQTINIGDDTIGTALNLQAGTGGIDITTTGSMATTVTGSSATAWVLDDGTNTYLTLDSTDTQLELGQFMDTGDNVGQGQTFTTAAAVTAARLLRMTATTGTVQHADATSGSATNLTSRIVGVAMETDGVGGGTIKVHTAYGVQVDVNFSGTAPVAADIGKIAYLDGATGQATLTAPSASGDFVVEVGIVMGAGATAPVMFAPRFVAAIA
jgi:hypothetical protein